MNKFKIGDIIHYNRNSFSCRGFLTVLVLKPWNVHGGGYSVYTLSDEAGYLKDGDIHFLTDARAEFYEVRTK